MSLGRLNAAVRKIITANKHLLILQDNADDMDQKTGNMNTFEAQAQDQSEIKYLDLFIQITEQCLNNSNRSATLCTDLIMQISQVISDPPSWKKHFNSTIQYMKNSIHEKLNQFLSNAILIVENQKPVQRIMIMALTNLVTIDEPDDETMCEMCLRTLKDLYKNNIELRKLLQSAIKKNVIGNLEQQDLFSVSQCLLRGLVNFGKEVDMGSWFTERQCQLIGRWLDQIFDCFDVKIIDQEKFQLIEGALELMSQGFKDENFSTLIENFIHMKGILGILDFCFDEIKIRRKMKPDDIFQKNKITFFVVEMVSNIPSFLKQCDKTEKQKYNTKIAGEIVLMINELSDKKFNYGYSDYAQNVEQCQIMNKKLGSLIKAQGQIIVDQQDIKLKENKVFEIIMNLFKERKIDPYIYGCMCQFLTTVLDSQCCKDNLENLEILFILSENMYPLLQMLSKQHYFELLNMTKIYANVIQPAEFSLSYMPTRELQYAIHSIVLCFKTLQQLTTDSSHPHREFILKKLNNLDTQNYKAVILQCIEAPIEEIRVCTAQIIIEIKTNKWEFDELKTFNKILEKMQVFLQEGYGEEEISTVMMILCKIVSQKSNPIAIQFKDSQIAGSIANVTHKILKINMNRNTKGDETQNKQKVELAASCVYMLRHYEYSYQLRPNLVLPEAMNNISESIRLEDQYIGDSATPLNIESLNLIIQPLFIALEADNAVSANNLSFFRVIMQITKILNFEIYEKAIQEEDLSSNQFQKIQNKQIFDNDAIEFENSGDILNDNKQQLMKLCFEQWNKWIPSSPSFDQGKFGDDLISAFEVQHTIFSSQNGVDRLLICLNPVLRNCPINLEDEEITIDSIVSSEHDSQKVKIVLTSAFSKHALFSKLIGYDNVGKNDVALYQSQFFETVQKKKTAANKMIDITKFNEEQFYQFMISQNSSKTKIALITSAFFYSCYISIQFAPTQEIQRNALSEIQQKYKLISFIKLCAISEWYNANVSIKLLKIYRLVIKHVANYFNISSSFDVIINNIQEQIKSIKKSDQPLEIIDEKLQQQKLYLAEVKERQKQKIQQLYNTQLSTMEQLENCKLINKMIQIIISDFKEILECLDQNQLVQQLKLLNNIFKTMSCIFKQLIIFACTINGSDDLEQNLFVLIRKCSEQIIVPIYFEELTLCLQKLDKKIEFNQSRFMQKLYLNLSQTLAFFYIKKYQDLNELFGHLCQKFDSPRLAAAVNASIKEWVLWMILLKMFSISRGVNTSYYKQIPIYVVGVDFKKIESFNFTKNCFIAFYTSMIIIFEPFNIQVNQNFLQNQLDTKNYKIYLQFNGFQIRSTDLIQEKDSEKEEFKIIELTIFNESNKDQILQLQFETEYIAYKVNKYFNLYLEPGNDNCIL